MSAGAAAPEVLPFRSANEAWAARVAAASTATAFRHHKGEARTAAGTGGWCDVTWREADEAAHEIAAGLVASGIKPGERVCLLLETRLEWTLCDVGALLAGAIPVPIYPSSTAEQVAHIVRDSGARAVVVENAAQLDKVLPLLLTGMDLELFHLEGDARLERPDARGRREVMLHEVMATVPREAARRIHDFATLCARGREPAAQSALAARAVAPGPDDVFTIIYTSGTTGPPKGVVLTHRNLIAACASAIRALTLQANDVHYLWLTLAHVFAREVVWVSLMQGLVVVFSRGLAKVKDDLIEIRPTFMCGVPRLYEKFHTGVLGALKQGDGKTRALAAWGLRVGERWSAAVRAGRTPGGFLALQHRLADKLVLRKLRARLGLDRCRFLVSGGAPLSSDVAGFFHAIGLLVLEGYGLTETSAAAFVNRPDRFRFGTVGPAVDVVEHKIADDGEVLLRGPSIFTRYHGNPAATAEALDRDGWFHTGDIGVIEDGFLRITDRKKDLIVLAGGKKVAPQVVENALRARTSLISQALVYGDRKPYCVALVTLSEEAVKRFGDGDGAKAAASGELRAGIKGAIDAVNATLAPFETIKSFAVLAEDFTEANGQLTPSLKVKRKTAVDRHRREIDGLYTA